MQGQYNTLNTAKRNQGGALGKVVIVVFLLAIVSVVGMFLSHMNSVPNLDEEAKAQWSQVQNQYKRRADLVPNLVNIVKGYAAHENETLNQVTQARSQVGKINIDADVLDDPEKMKQYLEVQKSLSSSLGRLMAVAESYPDLKADKNFLALQSQLEGTENRIAVARRDFINAVKRYNRELRTIPGKWVAQFLYPDAELRKTFSVSEKEQETPKVEF
ncbi:MAG: LemA family protein [Gammaproteobacteria bacterium]|nr:MAG: LemA family protein [Gammaproteobacteria bacterium]